MILINAKNYMHMLSNFFFLRFQFDKHMLPGTKKYDS